MNFRDNLLRKARKSKKESDWLTDKKKKNHVNNLIKVAKPNIINYYLKKTFLSQTNSGNVSKTCFLRNPKRKYPVPNLSSTRKQRQMNMTLRMDSVPFFSPLSHHLKPTRLNLRTLLGLNQQNTKLTMPNALISNTFQYQSLENI